MYSGYVKYSYSTAFIIAFKYYFLLGPIILSIISLIVRVRIRISYYEMICNNCIL